MTDLTPVTIIGMGPMGQAMARTLLSAGQTPSRADDLVAGGATLAATPADAVTASGLVILSLTDYQAMYDILGDSTGALKGATIVNLSSDTPARSRAAAAWAAEHGARFLVGGVMTPAPMVGTTDAFVYYSGPEDALAVHQHILELIGSIRFLGEDPRLAQLMYQAHLDVFLTSLSGLMHATALMGSAGMSATEFIPQALETLAGVPAMLNAGESPGRQIDERIHPGELSTTTMLGATAEHIVAASEAADIDLALPRAVRSHYRRAVADGHGADNWTSIIEGIKAP